MRFQILFFIAVLTVSIFSSGCPTAKPPVNSGNIKTTNSNAVSDTAANTKDAFGTTKSPEAATTNNAPTIAPVVQAYYEALKKKDDAGLKKVFSQATLKTLAADMKEEKKTSLVAYISELEPAPDKPFEVRNEKIEGETAIAEIKGGGYAVWTPYKFVREGGEWKMTNESPDFDAIQKSAGNSKSGK